MWRFDLAKIFDIALKSFMLYLAYRAEIHKIIPSVLANRRLDELEEERQQIMLDGIREEIRTALVEQHNERKAADARINDEGIDVKLDQVEGHIADQIIRGNEVKLLAAAPSEVEDDDETSSTEEKNRELRDGFQKVRKLRKSLNENDVKQLLTAYKQKDPDLASDSDSDPDPESTKPDGPKKGRRRRS